MEDMNRRKRTYGKPKMMMETFVPNQYVAACYRLACDTVAANAYEETIDNHPLNGHQTGAGTCGHLDAQIIDVGPKGEIRSAYEDKGFTKLDMRFTDSSYENELVGDIVVQTGTTLYWKTSGFGSVYHHQGVVTLNDANKSVNHS